MAPGQEGVGPQVVGIQQEDEPHEEGDVEGEAERGVEAEEGGGGGGHRGGGAGGGEVEEDGGAGLKSENS